MMILFRAKSIDRLRREQEKTTTHHSHITKWIRCKVSAYSDFFFKTNKASIFRVPGSLHIGLALIWIGRMIVCMCGLMLSIPLSMSRTQGHRITLALYVNWTHFCCCCCCSLHFFLSCAFVTFVAAAFFPPAPALRWWTHFYFVRLQFLFLTTYFTLSVMHRMSVWVSLCLCSIIFTNRKVAST